jgi:outer membrane immunogenic protein
VRGRLGVTVTPDPLLYGTGGLAYGKVDASANWFQFVDEQTPASVSKTKVGWTAGAGAEWMFAGNWSAKLEYLYVELGSDSAIGNFTPPDPNFKVGYTWNAQENIVRVDVNYQLIASAKLGQGLVVGLHQPPPNLQDSFLSCFSSASAQVSNPRRA